MVASVAPHCLFSIMTTINFYSYTGHNNTVNKQLGSPTQIAGDLRQTFDVLRPAIRIKWQSRPIFNYCYIETLGRYYFVESVEFVGNMTYDLALTIDVLKTYETQILDATGRVTERDNANPHISTRQNVYNMQPNFEKINFSNTGLLNETGTIVMITLKGTTNN